MNKIKVNIIPILKNFKVGTPLYCTMCGWVKFERIDKDLDYPIVCSYNNGSSYIYFTKYGYYYNSDDAECVIFPSDTCRTWDITHHGNYSTFIVGKFDKNTLKPFDKVLVRDSNFYKWNITLFAYINDSGLYCCINGCDWKYCIPYNDHTKHLLGTSNKEPDCYKQ